MATEKPTPKPIDNPDNGPDIQSVKPDNSPPEEPSDKVEIDDVLENGWGADFDSEELDGTTLVDEFDESIVFDNDPFDGPTIDTEKTVKDDESIDFDYGDSEDDFNSLSDPIAKPKENKEREESKNNQNDIEYTYHPNRSYFFVFGLPSAGKTVLLMSVYNYLTRKLSGNESYSNINNPKLPYEQLGNKLINQFIKYTSSKTFPPGTVTLEATNLKLPIHLNFKYTPDLYNKDEIEFCLMDMAGEDLSKINFDSYTPLPESIRTYVEDLPQRNLRFIFVIDPESDKAEQLALFIAFLNLIDINKHENTPTFIIISKWDTIQGYDNAKDYLINEYPEVWQEVRNPKRNFGEFGKFSIGKVNGNYIEEFDYLYSKKIINWIYSQHTGDPLDSTNDVNTTKNETWMQRLIRKIFK